jgi:molybdopterin converting factor small subunit
MAINVKLFMTLVPLSKSKKSNLSVDWFDGITAQHVLEAEEFSEQDQEAIAVVINSVQAQPDDPLYDGDQVDLLVNLQGGTLTDGTRGATSSQ